jgi:hypothetical protein
MESSEIFSPGRAAGALLALSGVVFTAGGLMFFARGGTAGKPAPSSAYLAWERGFVTGAAVLASLGFVALAAALSGIAGDFRIPMWLTVALYALAVVAVLVAEGIGLWRGQSPYALIVAYVVVAFLAQAAFGVIVIQSGLLPAWVGWAAIVWNLAWLVVLPMVAPRDIYFPVLHHAVPLVAGIYLLWRG